MFFVFFQLQYHSGIRSADFLSSKQKLRALCNAASLYYHELGIRRSLVISVLVKIKKWDSVLISLNWVFRSYLQAGEKMRHCVLHCLNHWCNWQGQLLAKLSWQYGMRAGQPAHSQLSL